MKGSIHTCCALVILTAWSPVEAQIAPGRYAHNGLEKICLRLGEQGRFELFTSTCTMDEHHVGTWRSAGDTLILHSDRQPRLRLGEVREMGPGEGAANGPLAVSVTSPDPLLLAGMRIRAGDRAYELDEAGAVDLPAEPGRLTLELDGLGPATYMLRDPSTSTLILEVVFEHLHDPHLTGERWLRTSRRKLTYLPGEGSNVDEETVEIRRGKRCFYGGN